MKKISFMWVCLEIDPVLCDWAKDAATRTWKGFATKKAADQYARGKDVVLIFKVILPEVW